MFTIEWSRIFRVETAGLSIFRIVKPESDMVCIYWRQYNGTIRFFVAIKTKDLVKKDRPQRSFDLDIRGPVVVGIEVALIPRKAKCFREIGVWCSVG